jgi:hypothetical protein
MAYLTEKTCLFIGEKAVTVPVKIEVLFVEMLVRVVFSLHIKLVIMAGWLRPVQKVTW